MYRKKLTGIKKIGFQEDTSVEGKDDRVKCRPAKFCLCYDIHNAESKFPCFLKKETHTHTQKLAFESNIQLKQTNSLFIRNKQNIR